MLPSSAGSSSPQDSKKHGRRLGTLLGLAIGDALGAAVELKPRGSFPKVTAYRDGGPHRLDAGEWTDDTSMALALADSIATKRWDLDDQAVRYLSWYRHGKYSVNGRLFDIGITTRSALERIERGEPARTGGPTADDQSGNGSIMRLAPVAIHYADLFPDRIDALATYAAESSYPTHRSAACVSACRYMSVVLAALMAGRPRDEVLSPDWPALDELNRQSPLHPAILAVARGRFRHKAPPAVRGSGYVVASLEGALWAFHGANNFEDAVLAAVNLGDDADTTGAICGQLAGAHFGVEGIARPLLEGLAKREWIEEAARRLCVESPPRKVDARSPAFVLAEGRATAVPTTRCYWVIPGRLLAGAYPGEPDAALHRARLEKLFGAGIRTFVSLMEVDETNNAGEAFVDYVATLQEIARHSGERVECVRFAVPDVSIPDRDTMAAILATIDRSLAEERPVYVHCFGGIGRTGTVVGCWLLRHGLASAKDVFDVIAQLRAADTARASRRSPETREQERFVVEWASKSTDTPV